MNPAQTNEEIIAYYVSLLIQRYCGQTSPQVINFSSVPASGYFTLTFGTLIIGPIAWNATNADVVSAFENLVTSPSSDPNNPETYFAQFPYPVTITGSPATSITIDFGNTAPATIFGFGSNSLADSGSHPISIVTTGELVKAAMSIQAVSSLNIMNQLPAIIQNAFNLIPTVQSIVFESAPTTGTFQITLAVTSTPSISTTNTAAINWNDSNQVITNKINAILPSGFVSLDGSLADGIITLSFTNVNPTVISVTSNSTGQTTSIETNLAFGAQLDVLAKYAGVSRNGNGPNGAVVLNDSDLYTLIQLGIIRNNSGSSLSDIDNLLFTFFQDNLKVTDNQSMGLSYTVNLNYFSDALLQCMLSQDLLPRPMGVQLASVIPIVNPFFSFCSASLPTNRTGPGFNDVNDYVLTSPWLSVGDIV